MGKLIISAKPNGSIRRGPGAKKNKSRKSRPKIPTGIKNEVLQRDGGRCVQCKKNKAELKKVGAILTYDHIIPWRVVGEHTVDNLQLMCDICNEWKGDKFA